MQCLLKHFVLLPVYWSRTRKRISLHCCCLLLPQASLRIRTSLALQQCFAIILLTNSKKLQERHDAVERQAPLLIMLIHRLRHKLLLKMCTHKVRKQKWITVFYSSFLSQKKKKYMGTNQQTIVESVFYLLQNFKTRLLFLAAQRNFLSELQIILKALQISSMQQK